MVHLFGEMEIDLSQNIDAVYKHAARISEACGYATAIEADHLDIFGEDCDDRIRIVSKVFFDRSSKKITKVEKHVFKNENDKLLKVIPWPNNKVFEVLKL